MVMKIINFIMFIIGITVILLVIVFIIIIVNDNNIKNTKGMVTRTWPFHLTSAMIIKEKPSKTAISSSWGIMRTGDRYCLMGPKWGWWVSTTKEWVLFTIFHIIVKLTCVYGLSNCLCTGKYVHIVHVLLNWHSLTSC